LLTSSFFFAPIFARIATFSFPNEFKSFIKLSVDQVNENNPKSFELFASFFEAFMGYYKYFESLYKGSGEE
jgi:CRISPR/Cas system CSM-associated protein Csm2 small subunit